MLNEIQLNGLKWLAIYFQMAVYKIIQFSEKEISLLVKEEAIANTIDMIMSEIKMTKQHRLINSEGHWLITLSLQDFEMLLKNKKIYQHAQKTFVIQKNKSEIFIESNHHRYTIIKQLDVEQAKNLYQQTGRIVFFPAHKDRIKYLIGQGVSAKIQLGLNQQNKQYVALKKIKKLEFIKNVVTEKSIQKKLNGKAHLLPLLDSKITEDNKGNPVIYFIYPLGLSSLGKLQEKKLPKTLFFRHLAHSLLKGCINMHQEQIVHLDLKEENCIVMKDASLYIIDFGTAKELESAPWVKEYVHGDSSIFSPERLAHYRYCMQTQMNFEGLEMQPCFNAYLADAWSIGLILLKNILGYYPFPLSQEKSERKPWEIRLNNWDNQFFYGYLEIAFKNSIFIEFENQHPEYAQIVRGLLKINDKERWEVSVAFKKVVCVSDDEKAAISEAIMSEESSKRIIKI